MSASFDHQSYTIRKKFFSLFGAKFHIYNPAGELVLFSSQKAFKLKEDIRLYSDETMSEEVITIQARSIIDFSACYDVVDAKSGEKLGVLQRKGLKSILKDEWIIKDKDENLIGSIHEDSALMATLRRFVTNLIPQKYEVKMNDKVIAQFKQHFNPFILKLDLDFSLDTEHVLDKRLGVAAGVLLCAIEGRQN